MGLNIENQGAGFIGTPGGDWRMALNSTPANLGESPGRLGSLSFNANCDETSVFTIDNYLSVQHLYDDQTNRWLSSFDGYVRSVNTNDKFASFGMNSILSALDVQRNISRNATGTYHRSIQLPSQVEYLISGVPYYTGGYYTSVGSENIWVAQDIIIYDVAARADFLYVLASGGHAGEVVFRFQSDGTLSAVWPVYSDATDTSSPGSKHISVTGSTVIIGQQNAKRVKRFTFTGTFVSQFGSAGTGNGQFQTISGVVGSNFFDSIFVTDSVLGRVQRFNYAGTYQNQWGTLGTGVGNTVFNAPGKINIDPISENVFVSDLNARVRAYDSFGNIQATPMGTYNFTTSASTGEYVKGRMMDSAFDQRGSAYGFQDGRIYKYVRTTNATSNQWFSGSARIWDGAALLVGTAADGTYSDSFAVDEVAGGMYIARNVNVVEKWGGSLGTLMETYNHYIFSAAPDFPWANQSGNLPDGRTIGAYPYLGWSDNVWTKLCELSAVTGNALVALDDRMVLVNRADRSYKIPDDATVTPVALDSRAAGRNVQITNYNSRWSTGLEVMYSANADNRRVFTIDVLGLTRTIVRQDTHPEYVLSPTAGASASNGVYTVVDSNEVQVDATTWANYGGAIKAELGEEPGSIVVTIIGPGLPIPGTQAPYKITDTGGTPTLTINGSGIVSSPEILMVGTGVLEEVSNTLVARRIDVPFVTSASIAYTEASWAAYNTGTPNQKITMSFHPTHAPLWVNSSTGIAGSFQFVNSIMRWKDSEYMVDTVDQTAEALTLAASRYNIGGHDPTIFANNAPARFEEIWSGSTTEQFEAFWETNTSQDFSVAPLRNPYGFNADYV